MQTYNLRISEPHPTRPGRESHVKTRVVFQAESYPAAVAFCHEKFREVRRTVTLYSGENGTHFWHTVSGYDCIALDRGLCSEVPEMQTIELEAAR